MKTSFGALLMMTAFLVATPALAQTGNDCVRLMTEVASTNLPAPSDLDARPAYLPNAIRVGEDWLVRLSPTTACDSGTCVVEWTSDQPAVATWLRSNPPCGRDVCAILEPLAPGTARLTARICTAEGWQSESFDVVVTR